MTGIKRKLYELVSWMRKSSQLNQLLQLVYLKITLIFGRPVKKHDRRLFQSPLTGQELEKHRPRIAFICDEMTWQDYAPYAEAIFLHPKCWKRQLKMFQPEFLFCESAWSGIEAYPNVWRGRIYRDRRVSYENRDVLRKILADCRKQGISTAFWNKEDPAYFDHPVYDFADTALLFDNVFTTAAECLEKYRSRGHSRVFLLPFGVNTEMFYSDAAERPSNTAMFAGSWFSDFPERCQKLERMLDYAISKGWKVDIYDRYSESKEERFRFPEKYTSHLHPAVPFSEMPNIYRKYTYAINVNTVTNSRTMLSRRVLQLAASGVTILSNNAQGYWSLTDCLEIYPTEEEDIILIRPRTDKMQEHSTRFLLGYVLDSIRLEEIVHV